MHRKVMVLVKLNALGNIFQNLKTLSFFMALSPEFKSLMSALLISELK